MRRIALIAALPCFVVACAPQVVQTPRSMPAAVQLNLLKLPRVWVAGFATGGRREFDLNGETVRLLRQELRAWSASVVDAEPLIIEANTLSEAPYWRRLGEEHGAPLIVTGSVRWLFAPAKIEQRGRRTVYVVNGRVLEATVVVIDGHTGEIMSSRRLPSRMHYPVGQSPDGLGCLFDMMDAGIRDWLDAISAVPVASHVEP